MEYKLFEIEWHYLHDGPFAKTKRGYRQVGMGSSIEGYRIFGFTDDPDWTDRYKNTAIHGSYKEAPCDAYGERLYAIGNKK